jgi:thiamine-phosphate pyrophosphorylase
MPDGSGSAVASADPASSTGRPPAPGDERLRLILVTDRASAGTRTVCDVVAAALEGGVRAVQLRNKGDSPRELLEAGRELRALTGEAGALLIVNDRLDLALALGADGVHLGPNDLPIAAARRVAGPDFLIGRSADDPTIARAAERDGVDYIGCGTVYPTSTKPDAGATIGLTGLERVCRAVRVPVVAIGGITVERSAEVARTSASGIAVVHAVMAADDPAAAARSLLAPWESISTRRPPGRPRLRRR